MKIDFLVPCVGTEISWLFKIGRVKLEISFDSSLKILFRDEVKSVVSFNDAVMILPLLEIDYEIIHNHIVKSLKESVSIDSIEFIEKLLIRCAFNLSYSDYWPLRGLSWLEKEQSFIDSFVDELNKVKVSSWATQKIKQKISSLLKISGKQKDKLY